MVRCFSRWTMALLVPAAIGFPTLAQDAGGLTPLVLPGGGVADAAGKIGYVPSKDGGIDAIDLGSGKIIWATKDANRPLLATAERLFAQAPVPGKANQVRIVVFDTTDKGKKLQASEPLTFPDWVSIGVAHGRSFASTARLHQKKLLYVWQARGWYAGGARPTPEIEKAARKAASGVAQVDLDLKKWQDLQGEQIPKGTPQQVPADVQKAKVGQQTYVVMDRPGPKTFQRLRSLRALDAGGAVVWEQEIAAPVILPPLP
jgi:hypothetical protein